MDSERSDMRKGPSLAEIEGIRVQTDVRTASDPARQLAHPGSQDASNANAMQIVEVPRERKSNKGRGMGRNQRAGGRGAQSALRGRARRERRGKRGAGDMKDQRGEDSGDELKYGDKPDPLYDEELDDKDSQWVFDRYLSHTRRNSDAVLNCPACFTVLCFDCQRHSFYPNQYRAMFVQNCKVMLNKTTRPVKGDTDPDAVYHQVHCSKCELYVAVRDNEEVYHFHNVLPSENSGDQNKKATKKPPKVTKKTRLT